MDTPNERGNGHRDTLPAMSDAERIEVIEGLIGEVADAFRDFSRGDLTYSDLTFEVFDALQSIHALASGRDDGDSVWRDDERTGHLKGDWTLQTEPMDLTVRDRKDGN